MTMEENTEAAGNQELSSPATSLDGAETALRRAAQSAYRRAAFHGSKIVVAENGKTVLKTPVPVDPNSTKPPIHQEYKLV